MPKKETEPLGCLAGGGFAILGALACGGLAIATATGTEVSTHLAREQHENQNFKAHLPLASLIVVGFLPCLVAVCSQLKKKQIRKTTLKKKNSKFLKKGKNYF